MELIPSKKMRSPERAERTKWNREKAIDAELINSREDKLASSLDRGDIAFPKIYDRSIAADGLHL